GSPFRSTPFWRRSVPRATHDSNFHVHTRHAWLTAVITSWRLAPPRPPARPVREPRSPPCSGPGAPPSGRGSPAARPPGWRRRSGRPGGWRRRGPAAWRGSHGRGVAAGASDGRHGVVHVLRIDGTY